MAIQFLNQLQFNQNEALQLRLENVITSGIPAVGNSAIGQVLYDTTNLSVKVFDGTSWESISGDITSLLPGL
jgi:hypothetical protein